MLIILFCIIFPDFFSPSSLCFSPLTPFLFPFPPPLNVLVNFLLGCLKIVSLESFPFPSSVLVFVVVLVFV